jgi:hypothetical protein
LIRISDSDNKQPNLKNSAKNNHVLLLAGRERREMRPFSPQFQNLLLATWGQWFREGNNVFDGLAVAYGLLATVALV